MEMEGYDQEMDEEFVDEGEDIIGEINPGILLTSLGTLILCAGVALAFIISSSFSSQEVLTLTLTEVTGKTAYSGNFWVIIQLLASIIIIWAGGKLIDKGISFNRE